jgi:tetratricopeptide (TPR) repeat protein
MVVSQGVNTHPEPTPDFNERTKALLKQWNSGEVSFESALEQARALQQEAALSRHLANQGRAEHILGYLQNHRGNLTTSILHYERARSLFVQVKNKQRIATIDLNQGENYRAKGDFIRAQQLYHAAYQAATELNYVLLQTTALTNEGQMSLTLNKHDEALKSLLEAQRLAPLLDTNDSNTPALISEIHHALALVYTALKRYEDAWREARAAVRMANEANLRLQIGLANRAAGEVLAAWDTPTAGDYSTDPDDYFQAATDIFRDMNAEGELARTIFSHSKSLAKRGKRMTAARKLQQAMIIFTRLGMTNDAAQVAKAQLVILGTKEVEIIRPERLQRGDTQEF